MKTYVRRASIGLSVMMCCIMHSGAQVLPASLDGEGQRFSIQQLAPVEVTLPEGPSDLPETVRPSAPQEDAIEPATPAPSPSPSPTPRTRISRPPVSNTPPPLPKVSDPAPASIEQEEHPSIDEETTVESPEPAGNEPMMLLPVLGPSPHEGLRTSAPVSFPDAPVPVAMDPLITDTLRVLIFSVILLCILQCVFGFLFLSSLRQ